MYLVPPKQELPQAKTFGNTGEVLLWYVTKNTILRFFIIW